MGKKIDKSVLSERWVMIGGRATLTRVEGVVEKWNEAKKNRSKESKTIKRLIKDLKKVHTYLKEKYPTLVFKFCTDWRAYHDEQTKEDDPDFWWSKYNKKTWSGISPLRMKGYSDLDFNVFLEDGTPLTNEQIKVTFLSEQTHPVAKNLIYIGGVKLDFYEYHEYKKEPQILLEEAAKGNF